MKQNKLNRPRVSKRNMGIALLIVILMVSLVCCTPSELEYSCEISGENGVATSQALQGGEQFVSATYAQFTENGRDSTLYFLTPVKGSVKNPTYRFSYTTEDGITEKECAVQNVYTSFPVGSKYYRYDGQLVSGEQSQASGYYWAVLGIKVGKVKSDTDLKFTAQLLYGEGNSTSSNEKVEVALVDLVGSNGAIQQQKATIVDTNKGQSSISYQRNEYFVGDIVSFTVTPVDEYSVTSVSVDGVVLNTSNGAYTFVAKKSNNIVVTTQAIVDAMVDCSITLDGQPISEEFASKLKIEFGTVVVYPTSATFAENLLKGSQTVTVAYLDDNKSPSGDAFYYTIHTQKENIGRGSEVTIALTSSNFGNEREIVGKDVDISAVGQKPTTFNHADQGTVLGGIDDSYTVTFGASFAVEDYASKDWTNHKFRVFQMDTYSQGASPTKQAYPMGIQLECMSDGVWAISLYLWNGNSEGTVLSTFQSKYLTVAELDAFFGTGLEFILVKDADTFKLYTHDGANYHNHITAIDPAATIAKHGYETRAYMEGVTVEGTLSIKDLSIALGNGLESLDVDYDTISLGTALGYGEKQLNQVGSYPNMLSRQITNSAISSFTIAFPNATDGDFSKYDGASGHSDSFVDYQMLIYQAGATSGQVTLTVRINFNKTNGKAVVMLRSNYGGTNKDLYAYLTDSQKALLVTGLDVFMAWKVNADGTHTIALLADNGDGSFGQIFNYTTEDSYADYDTFKYVNFGHGNGSAGDLTSLTDDDKVVLTNGLIYQGFAQSQSILDMITAVESSALTQVSSSIKLGEDAVTDESVAKIIFDKTNCLVNDTISFTITHGALYGIKEVKVNGVVVSAVDGVYSFKAQKENTVQVLIDNAVEFESSITLDGAPVTDETVAKVVLDSESYIAGNTVTFTVPVGEGYVIQQVKANGVIIEAENKVYSFVAQSENTIQVVLVHPVVVSGSITLDGQPITDEFASKLQIWFGDESVLPTSKTFTIGLLADSYDVIVRYIDDNKAIGGETLYYVIHTQQATVNHDGADSVAIALTSGNFGNEREIVGKDVEITAVGQKTATFNYADQGTVLGKAESKYTISFKASYETTDWSGQNWAGHKFRVFQMDTYSEGVTPVKQTYPMGIQLENMSGTWAITLYLWNGNTSGTVLTAYQSKYVTQAEIEAFFGNGLEFILVKDGSTFKLYTHDGVGYHGHVSATDPTASVAKHGYETRAYMEGISVAGTLRIKDLTIALANGLDDLTIPYDTIALRKNVDGSPIGEQTLQLNKGADSTSILSLGSTTSIAVASYTLKLTSGEYAKYLESASNTKINLDMQIYPSGEGDAKTVRAQILFGGGQKKPIFKLYGGFIADKDNTAYFTDDQIAAICGDGLNVMLVWKTNGDGTFIQAIFAENQGAMTLMVQKTSTDNSGKSYNTLKYIDFGSSTVNTTGLGATDTLVMTNAHLYKGFDSSLSIFEIVSLIDGTAVGATTPSITLHGEAVADENVAKVVLGAEKYYAGQTVTFTIPVGEGYVIKEVAVNGAVVSATNGTYSFKALGSNTIAVVLGEIAQVSSSVKLDDYAVAESDAKVVLGASSYLVGDTVTFTIFGDKYHIATVKANGQTLSASEGVYSFTALKQNAIEVVLDDTANVTTSVKLNEVEDSTAATINGLQANYKVGDEISFTITCQSYNVRQVTVNGQEISSSDGTFTFTASKDNAIVVNVANVADITDGITLGDGAVEDEAIAKIAYNKDSYLIGDVVEMTITVGSAYGIKSVTANGNVITVANGKYSFEAQKQNTVTVVIANNVSIASSITLDGSAVEDQSIAKVVLGKASYIADETVTFTIPVGELYRVTEVKANGSVLTIAGGKYSFVAQDTNTIAVTLEKAKAITVNITADGQPVSAEVVSKLKLDFDGIVVMPESATTNVNLFAGTYLVTVRYLDDNKAIGGADLYYEIYTQEENISADGEIAIALSSLTYGANREIVGASGSATAANQTITTFNYADQGTVLGGTADKYTVFFKAAFPTANWSSQTWTNNKFRVFQMDTYSEGDSPTKQGYSMGVQLESTNTGLWVLSIYLWNGATSGTTWTTYQSKYITTAELDAFFGDGLEFILIKDGADIKLYTKDAVTGYHKHIEKTDLVASTAKHGYETRAYMPSVGVTGTLYISDFKIALGKGIADLSVPFESMGLAKNADDGKSGTHTLSLNTASSSQNMATPSRLVRTSPTNVVVARYTLKLTNSEYSRYLAAGSNTVINFDLLIYTSSNAETIVRAQVLFGGGSNKPIFKLYGGIIENANNTAYFTDAQISALVGDGVEILLVWKNNGDGTYSQAIYADDGASGYSKMVEKSSSSSSNYTTFKYINFGHGTTTAAKLDSTDKAIMTNGMLYSGFDTSLTIAQIVDLIK